MELRAYQQEGIEFLSSRKAAILADEMGLGKSVQALKAMLMSPLVQGDRILILCPKSAVSVWQAEMVKWLPAFNDWVVTYLGQKHKRQKMADELEPPYILITTYETFRRDQYELPGLYDFVIADEAHKFRNRKTATFKSVKRIVFNQLFMLTGTPGRSGPHDLWTMLNLCDARRFSSYWKFVNTFCVVHDGQFGKEILGPKNLANFKPMLAHHMLRRYKKDVAPELPPKTRQMLSAAMTKTQVRIYDELASDMIAKLDDEGTLLVSLNTLSQLTRLRQIIVSPQMLGIDDDGGGIKAICDHIEDTEQFHCVLFTPFASALPYFQEYIENRFHKRLLNNEGDISVLRGGMRSDQVTESIRTFTEHEGIMLCSIKFSQGFSLSTASHAYFLGYEYTPDENHQAEDRLHRLTTKNPVHVFYVKHELTVDGQLLEILNTKNRSVTATLKRTDEVKKLLVNL